MPMRLPNRWLAPWLRPQSRADAPTCGIAGLIYSLGMDELAQRINRTGVQAGVDTYYLPITSTLWISRLACW
jgi:hypothetical protein